MSRCLFIVILWGAHSFAQPDENILLIARNTGQKILANGDTIGTMGYAYNLLDNPNIPGPTLEFFEGDSIYIDLWNVSQGAPHTIHLHGLDVNQQNDGVPHLSFDVHHMDHGYYRFKAPHPGTYLYHCHVTSPIHVQGGMYGMIIIHPKNEDNFTWSGGYQYEFDASLLFSEIDTVWHNDTIIDHEHDTTTMEMAIPEYHPQFYLINGLSDWQITDSIAVLTAAESQTYIRLANIGFKGNRVIFPAEFNAQIIDSDGRPLPTSELNDTVYLWPGERYGVIGSMPLEGVYQITVDYLSMNSDSIENTQFLPLLVSGHSEISSIQDGALEVELFPNPANDYLTIALNETGAIFSLMDEKGNIVFNQILDTKNSISLASFSSGIYFYQIISKTGKSAQGKLVIQ